MCPSNPASASQVQGIHSSPWLVTARLVKTRGARHGGTETIPALRRLRQEDLEFEARLCKANMSKKKKKKKPGEASFLLSHTVCFVLFCSFIKQKGEAESTAEKPEQCSSHKAPGSLSQNLPSLQRLIQTIPRLGVGGDEAG